MSDRLATAKWEPQPEVVRKYPYNFHNFWLGRAEDGSAIGYADDRHICLGDRRAAILFSRKLLRTTKRKPRVITTDKLRS